LQLVSESFQRCTARNPLCLFTLSSNVEPTPLQTLHAPSLTHPCSSLPHDSLISRVKCERRELEPVTADCSTAAFSFTDLPPFLFRFLFILTASSLPCLLIGYSYFIHKKCGFAPKSSQGVLTESILYP